MNFGIPVQIGARGFGNESGLGKQSMAGVSLTSSHPDWPGLRFRTPCAGPSRVPKLSKGGIVS